MYASQTVYDITDFLFVAVQLAVNIDAVITGRLIDASLNQ